MLLAEVRNLKAALLRIEVSQELNEFRYTVTATEVMSEFFVFPV